MGKFTKDDCIEIASAAEDADIQKKIGTDGELLAAGEVKLAAAERRSILADVNAKIERLQAGFYDDYKGECKRPRSTTGKWITHMQEIAAKLAS